MPKQPWPTGAAKEVAVQLGVPNSLVAAAIAELIKRGIFMTQIDGRLNELPTSKHDVSEKGLDSQ